MKRATILKYTDSSVRLNYKTDIGEQKRVGVLAFVGGKYVVFWPLEEDKELVIELNKIISVWPVKPQD